MTGDVLVIKTQTGKEYMAAVEGLRIEENFIQYGNDIMQEVDGGQKEYIFDVDALVDVTSGQGV